MSSERKESRLKGKGRRQVPEGDDTGAGSGGQVDDLLRTLIDVVPVAVYVCDAAGVILYYNRRAAELWGREPRLRDTGQRLCGSLRMYDAEGRYLPHERSLMAVALETGESQRDKEVVLERPDGSRIVVAVNIAAVKDAAGRVAAAVNVFQDITSRREAERQLQAGEERRGQLASELRALSQRLLEVQEEERRHLARELHDEVGQRLTALKFGLASAADISAAEAAAQLDDLIRQVGDLSLDLRPPALDTLGLRAALQALFNRGVAETGVAVKFKHRKLDQRFAPEVQTAAYRIVQEALTNVARHAGVREASVRARVDEGRLHIEVADRGAGFDPAAARGATAGLTGMRERAILAGGRLEIESVPGAGTRILAELPAGGRSG
ncbi:MAG TPA: PAS domain S-box protein [Thermoanaerobaculia bacterium]|nr:PAS domain S-box protein [Thermoanaerobaculia bacterium]